MPHKKEANITTFIFIHNSERDSYFTKILTNIYITRKEPVISGYISDTFKLHTTESVEVN